MSCRRRSRWSPEDLHKSHDTRHNIYSIVFDCFLWRLFFLSDEWAMYEYEFKWNPQKLSLDIYEMIYHYAVFNPSFALTTKISSHYFLLFFKCLERCHFSIPYSFHTQCFTVSCSCVFRIVVYHLSLEQRNSTEKQGQTRTVRKRMPSNPI